MISEQIGLDLLRAFVAVCRQGSLSRVAAQTGRTQSALSMQMRRLESLLDRQLFQRTGRGVVPTAEGELFLGYATRILALSDEAVDRLRQTEISGGVRIGLAEEVATAALPAALGRLHRAYPDIRLDMVVEHSIALGKLWVEDGLDIMIGPTSAAGCEELMSSQRNIHDLSPSGVLWLRLFNSRNVNRVRTRAIAVQIGWSKASKREHVRMLSSLRLSSRSMRRATLPTKPAGRSEKPHTLTMMGT